eukprot:356000-Chlamydomonas_euryale.AAC.3
MELLRAQLRLKNRMQVQLSPRWRKYGCVEGPGEPVPRWRSRGMLKREVWACQAIDAATPQYIDTATPYTLELNASLWEMGNHLIASARNVLENHATLAAANGGNLTASPDWQYVLRNGRDAIAPQVCFGEGEGRRGLPLA